MTVLRIDNHTAPTWRCESHTVSPPMACLRVGPADWYVPDELESTDPGGVFYCLEVVLTGRVLMCWTGAPVTASAVLGINRATRTIQMKTGDTVSCQITQREPTDSEQAFIQQERLIESNNDLVAELRAGGKVPTPLSTPPPAFAGKLEIDEAILWHVQQRIVDELDSRLDAARSASLVFTRYCRDRLTLAEMRRRYKWPYRTLKLRKAGLEEFLCRQFNGLRLADFFVDRGIFRAAERQLKSYREQLKG